MGGGRGVLVEGGALLTYNYELRIQELGENPAGSGMLRQRDYVPKVRGYLGIGMVSMKEKSHDA